MSAVSDLVNGWPGGIIQASRHAVFVTPFSSSTDIRDTPRRRTVATSIAGPTFDSTSEGRGVPVLDAVVSRSADRRTIVLKLVNTDLVQDLYVDVRVRGTAVRPRAERVVLAAASLMARTSFRAPDAIRPERDSIETGEAFQMRLPKHSVTVVALDVAR